MANKSLNEIRSTFLKYFENNDHKIVESSNLVPNTIQHNVCKFWDGTIQECIYGA